MENWKKRSLVAVVVIAGLVIAVSATILSNPVTYNVATSGVTLSVTPSADSSIIVGATEVRNYTVSYDSNAHTFTGDLLISIANTTPTTGVLSNNHFSFAVTVNGTAPTFGTCGSGSCFYHTSPFAPIPTGTLFIVAIHYISELENPNGMNPGTTYKVTLQVSAT